jgi:branched-chain amino acid transport system substrate-binding protein
MAMKWLKRLLMTTALCTAAATGQAQTLNGVIKIGVLNDQSGPYADLSGPGSVVAAQMAAEDFGGKVLGVPIEIIAGDHQNKADVGSAIVRRWIDTEKVSAVVDVPTSSVALAVQDILREKQKVFLISGAATADLSGKSCSPFSIQTADDTYALSVGTTRAVVESGANTWFYLVADYVFGRTIEAESSRLVKEGGGQVLGSAYHPQGTTDFAAYLLQAQGSHAKAIGLANAGNDTINAIKQAGEFGITSGGQKLVGLILFISDIHALGLASAHGLLLTEGFYWDMNDPARAWSRRFYAKFGKMPTREQATGYATIIHYLKSIQAAGTDDAKTVVAEMKKTPMDYFGSTGNFQANGRFMHDLGLYEVKTPAESKEPWDYYKLVRSIPAATAFLAANKSGCPLIKQE